MERQITAIHVQKHDPNRLNIELDGEFAFGLSRLVAAWLKVGDLLDEDRINTLIKSDSSEVAYQKATRLLDYRPRTEKEIRQRLTQKEFSTLEIDQVVLRLKRANLVQDEKFAKMWIENRNDFHPRSQRLIRYELRIKGVAEQTIESALADSADDLELATRAAAQYARKLNFQDRVLFRKKLSAYLARRGFSYGTISPVIRDLICALEQDQSTKLENEDDNGKY
ncbi:MAG: RecX family transcriptional regulator [Anaerolineaceae bacterium]|nr:RecX family transcriptional regulator [Anaerolineaceae bacterium]